MIAPWAVAGVAAGLALSLSGPFEGVTSARRAGDAPGPSGARRLARGLDQDARLWTVSRGGTLVGYSSSRPPSGSPLRRRCGPGGSCPVNAYLTRTRDGRSRQIGTQPVHFHELVPDALAGGTRRFPYTAYRGFGGSRRRFPVFMYDRRTHRSRQIWSVRGRYAAFVSADHRTLLANTAADLTGRTGDVVAYDLANGRERTVNVDAEGRRLPGSAALDDASADGRFVLLEIQGPCPSSCDGSAPYLRDLQTGATTRIAADSFDSEVSDDGQQVLLGSEAALAPDDANGQADCYLWTPTTGVTPAAPFAARAPGNACALSPDGRWLAIVTPDPLTAQDRNHRLDVYVRSLPAGAPRLISGALPARAVVAPGDVRFAPDGSFVAWVGEAAVGEGAIFGAVTGG